MSLKCILAVCPLSEAMATAFQLFSVTLLLGGAPPIDAVSDLEIFRLLGGHDWISEFLRSRQNALQAISNMGTKYSAHRALV